jgi:hypothetical protein
VAAQSTTTPLASFTAAAGTASQTPALHITGEGNVGIGTTAPQYDLQTDGSVAARSFVNVSSKGVKTDIEHVDKQGKKDLMEVARDIDIARYNYGVGQDDAESTTQDSRGTDASGTSSQQHLGLIAEEAPEEVLAKSGKGVDLYKLSTLALAGVQETDQQVQELQGRVASIESIMGELASTSDEIDGPTENTLVNFVIETLGKIGIHLGEGSITTQEVETERLCVDGVCVTKDELQQMLDSANVDGGTSGGSQQQDTTESGTDTTDGSSDTPSPGDTNNTSRDNSTDTASTTQSNDTASSTTSQDDTSTNNSDSDTAASSTDSGASNDDSGGTSSTNDSDDSPTATSTNTEQDTNNSTQQGQDTTNTADSSDTSDTSASGDSPSSDTNDQSDSGGGSNTENANNTDTSDSSDTGNTDSQDSDTTSTEGDTASSTSQQ